MHGDNTITEAATCSLASARSDQHLSLCIQCGLPVLALDVASQLNDIAFELLVRSNPHNQPLEKDSLVGVDGAAKRTRELKAHYCPCLGKVRCCKRQQQGTGLRSARDEALVFGGRRKLGVMMHWISIADGLGKSADH